MLRLSGHLISARHLPNRQPMFRLFVFGHQLGQQLVDQLGRRAQRGRDLRLGKRLLGDINHSFEHCFDLRLGRRGGLGLLLRLGQQIFG